METNNIELIKTLKAHAPSTSDHDWYTAYSKSIALLNRDYPEKPTRFEFHYECRRCREVVYPRNRFCPYCGQHIDWSED